MSEETQLVGIRELNSYSDLTLKILIWKPSVTTAGDFECVYRIVGYDGEKKGRSIGVDGIQAIWLAMKKIGSELDVIENKLSTKFFIGVDGSNPDHGFPKLSR